MGGWSVYKMEYTKCRSLRLFMSIYINYLYRSIYIPKENYVDNNTYLMGSSLALRHGIG